MIRGAISQAGLCGKFFFLSFFPSEKIGKGNGGGSADSMCVPRFVVCEYWPPGNVVSNQENLYLKNVGRPGQPFKEPSKDVNANVPPYKGTDIQLPESLANDHSDGSTPGAGGGGGGGGGNTPNSNPKPEEQQPPQNSSPSPSPSPQPQDPSRAVKVVTVTITRKRKPTPSPT